MFVLSGIPRTGTTVVAGSLVTHPEILFYGELLNNLAHVRETEAARVTMGAGWQITESGDKAVRACGDDEDGGHYLRQFFALPTSAALGFKLLDDQAVAGPHEPARKFLATMPDLKVVRTCRENLLEVVVSYVRAQRSRRWHHTSAPAAESQLHIPAEECAALFGHFTRTPPWHDQLLSSAQILKINYDRILSEFSLVMSEIFEFLGVDPKHATKPQLKKIARASPAAEVANFGELREYFAATPYAHYFDEH